MANSEQEQELAWSQEIPNYGNKLLKRLDEFRKTTLYDVCVHTQNGDVNAHKVILAACGGIFRTCFVDEAKKMINDTPDITLNCPYQGLKPIIHFAYSGSLVVTKRNAIATMMAAEVINMKEVQEICAGIAVKEYGWVANYSGEKTPAIIEKLKKVLRIHSQCFISASSENRIAANAQNFPFSEEVQNEIPDHVTTYHKLVERLKNAELVAAPPKVINKKSNIQKMNGTNGTVQDTAPPGPAAVNTKPSEPKITTKKAPEVIGRAPSPKQQNREITDNLPRTNDVTDSTTAVRDETNTPDSSKSTSSSSSKSTSVNTSERESDQQQPEAAVSTPTETSVTEHVDKAAPATPPAIQCGEDSNKNAVLIEETTTSTDAVPTPTPPTRPARTPRKDIPSPAPQRKPTPDVSSEGGNGKSTGSSNGEDTGTSLLRAHCRDNISTPSPKIKPRASMKVKKAPPPPPTAAPTASTEKPTPEKPPAPRRSMKTPQKVPPPRPKPPSVKKKSMSEVEVPSKTSTADEYDDSLNPFS